jgi:hypothetical protein
MGAFTEHKSVTGSVQYTDNPLSAGDTVQPATGSISVKNVQFGPFCQTTLTLNNVPQAIVNGTEYQSTKIYDLPDGRIHVVGCVATLQQKTTSALASTLNASVTGAMALGTAAASNVSLTGTMVDLLPSTAFTSSATINVAGTAVSAALAAAAAFDGTTTAKDVYLNTAFATTTDVDGNATQTISGTITLTWINLGDY